METINRGTGITGSERKLAKVADKTFLDLWSYPNTYNDRDMAKGQGKELCDLLVVCGSDVLIFSDKHIRWPAGSTELAWSRWYKRAVTHSVNQIRGAERWIRKYPDRVFIDPRCTRRLPINLPDVQSLNVHGIAVVGGAKEACRRHFSDPDGALLLMGREYSPNDEFPPFTIGDPDPNGSFVHVLDAESLSLVMRELDTMTDFVRYLKGRAQFFRDGHLGMASGERELLAAYMMTAGPDGKPNMPSPEEHGGSARDLFVLGPGEYSKMKCSAAYRARKELDQVSYSWDRLILEFSKNLLGGTTVSIAGMKPEIGMAEQALRRMALEDRLARRSLAYAIRSAVERADEEGQDRFARVILPFDGCADPECGYVFLVMAFRGEWLTSQGYEFYREGRAAYLKAYCQVGLFLNRSLKRMVGVAVAASSKITGRRGGSEDLMMVQITEWTPELEAETIELREQAEILMPETTHPSRMRQKDLKEMDDDKRYSGNRAQRRAARSNRRKGFNS